jgi:hypothetical protein
MKIEDMELSVRADHCLSNAGIKTLEQLYKSKDSELLKIKGLGKKTLKEIRLEQDEHILRHLEEFGKPGQKELWIEEQFKMVVNTFIIPLAEMYLSESYGRDVVELCQKADWWMKTSRSILKIIKE